jgi:hypothetical protein
MSYFVIGFLLIAGVVAIQKWMDSLKQRRQFISRIYFFKKHSQLYP